MSIGYRWLDDSIESAPYKGFIDLFDIELLAGGISKAPIEHEVLRPSGRFYALAKCLLTVDENVAILDYEAFAELNERRGILLGVTKFEFSLTQSPIISRLWWRSQGDSQFHEEEFDFIIRKRKQRDLRERSDQFEEDLKEALELSEEERRRLLPAEGNMPVRITVTTTVFVRNPYVVAETLYRAGGRCERCGSKAPFIRKGNRSPYLEVHHKRPLSEGGTDDMTNTIAICPNCHRELHYGVIT